MLDEKTLNSFKLQIKRLSGAVLRQLENCENDQSKENLLLDIDENLSRASWRIDQLIRSISDKNTRRLV